MDQRPGRDRARIAGVFVARTRAAPGKDREGFAPGLRERGIGGIDFGFGPEHQAVKPRVVVREGEVGLAQFGQVFAARAFRLAQPVAQPLEAERGDRRHQRALVPEMGIGRGLADADLARDRTQADRGRAAALDEAQRGLDQRAAKVPVVIGIVGHFGSWRLDASARVRILTVYRLLALRPKGGMGCFFWL